MFGRIRYRRLHDTFRVDHQRVLGRLFRTFAEKRSMRPRAAPVRRVE